MTYILEIKETEESKPLIEHLRTLKYVKLRKGTKEALSDSELAREIRKSEKSKPIKWEDAKKIIASWK